MKPIVDQRTAFIEFFKKLLLDENFEEEHGMLRAEKSNQEDDHA
jgi:hypothetical protein